MGNELEGCSKNTLSCLRDNNLCQLDCMKKEDEVNILTGTKETNLLQLDEGNINNDYDFDADSQDKNEIHDTKNEPLNEFHKRINTVENIEILVSQETQRMENNQVTNNIPNNSDNILVDLNESDLDKEIESLGLNKNPSENLVEEVKEPTLRDNNNQVVTTVLSNLNEFKHDDRRKDQKYISSLDVYQ